MNESECLLPITTDSRGHVLPYDRCRMTRIAEYVWALFSDIPLKIIAEQTTSLKFHEFDDQIGVQFVRGSGRKMEIVRYDTAYPLCALLMAVKRTLSGARSQRACAHRRRPWRRTRQGGAMATLIWPLI